MRRLSWLSWIVLSASLTAQAPVTRDIAPGGTVNIPIDLGAGTFVSVRVDRASDLTLSLLDPAGTPVSAVRATSISPAVQRLTAIAEAAGAHQLTIRASASRAAGPFVMMIEERRPATADDRRRLALGAALAAAERSRNQGTAASLGSARAQFTTIRDDARALGSTADETAALVGLARSQDALGDKRVALETYSQALMQQRAARDVAGEANTLNYMALVDDFLGDRQEALRLLATALDQARASGDRRIEGVSLNNLGLVNGNLGDRRKALDYYQQALAIHRDLGNVRGQATTLTNIGSLYDVLGDKPNAIKTLREALTLRRQIGDPREEAATLNNLAFVYFTADDLDAAVDLYRQALEKWRLGGDRGGEAATLHNMAGVMEMQGDAQRAIDQYTAALAVERAAQSRVAEGNTLNNLGRVYSTLGDHARAIETYQQALAIHRAVGNKTSEASTLSNLGAEELSAGQIDRATASLNQAIALWQNAGDKLGEARTLIGLGRAETKRGNAQAAADTFRRSLDLSRATGSRRTEAGALGQLASAEAAAGHFDAAWPLFDEAVARQREIQDTRGEATTLYSRAFAERSAGRLPQARDDVAAAVDLVESLRTSVMTPELRMSYFGEVQDYFELAVDVLVRLATDEPSGGWTDKALEMSERARARGFLDLLAESRTDIYAGVDPAIVERERSLTTTIAAKAERQTRLLSGTHTEAQAKALADEVRALTHEHQDVEGQLRLASPRYASLTRTGAAKAADIRAALDANTVLVEFALGTPRSTAFLVSARAETRAVPLASRADIDAAATAFHRALRTPGSPGVDAAGRALARLILAPLGPLSSVQRLAIVAPGSLQYVPFAALPDTAGKPLIASHELVTLPSVSALLAMREITAGRSPPAKSLMMFADPVYGLDDPRVAASRTSPNAKPSATVTRSLEALGPDAGPARLDRLIGSRREASAIAALVPGASFHQALDFDASRALAMNADLANYRVVHFATHALVSGEHPELSGIVLSLFDRNGGPQDGFLGLQDVVRLKLNADLVVLSACQTALGQDVRGEGLIGLSRGFMFAGSPRVIASAWKVDDTATAELMRTFYQEYFGPKHLAAPAALRAAQLAVMQQRRWQDPYYWAPFVLQGDWK